MSRLRADGLQYDLGLSIAAADSFRALAQDFIGKIHPNKDLADGRNIGAMVASATNLTFSIELYLKACYIFLNLGMNKEHHLWNLFKRLPSTFKAAIETNYDEASKGLPLVTAEFRVTIATRPTSAEEVRKWNSKENEKRTPNDLQSLLIRNADAFRSWRYLYESKNTDGLSTVIYEFLRLELVCDAIRSKIAEGPVQYAML